MFLKSPYSGNQVFFHQKSWLNRWCENTTYYCSTFPRNIIKWQMDVESWFCYDYSSLVQIFPLCQSSPANQHFAPEKSWFKVLFQGIFDRFRGSSRLDDKNGLQCSSRSNNLHINPTKWRNNTQNHTWREAIFLHMSKDFATPRHWQGDCPRPRRRWQRAKKGGLLPPQFLLPPDTLRRSSCMPRGSSLASSLDLFGAGLP